MRSSRELSRTEGSPLLPALLAALTGHSRPLICPPSLQFMPLSPVARAIHQPAAHTSPAREIAPRAQDVLPVFSIVACRDRSVTQRPVPAHATTNGNPGGKLPTGNAASRSPVRSFSAASRNAAKNSPYASHRAFRTFFRKAWKNGAGDFLIFRGRVSGFGRRSPRARPGASGGAVDGSHRQIW